MPKLELPVRTLFAPVLVKYILPPFWVKLPPVLRNEPPTVVVAVGRVSAPWVIVRSFPTVMRLSDTLQLPEPLSVRL